MNKKLKKLVLFDIDGTLIDSSAKSVGHWKERITAVFEKVYGKKGPFEIDAHSYNGQVDKQVLRLVSEKIGIPREIFDKRFPKAREVYHQELLKVLDTEDPVYIVFEDARNFVHHLLEHEHIGIGVITGNIERNAWAKLKKVGLDELFSFGAFSDDVESRAELVEHALKKAAEHFGIEFALSDVIVVGDTVHDIRAAKSGGVMSIGVSTGVSTTIDELIAEGADLAVTSLMDERVFDFLELPHVSQKRRT